MPRSVSAQHLQSLRDDLYERTRIFAIPSVQTGSGLKRMLKDLGLAATEGTKAYDSRLRIAAAELGQALAAIQEQGDEGGRAVALEGWIERCLLIRGPDLLISEPSRRKLLGRQRDKFRRGKARPPEDARMVRITLKRKSWEELRLVCEGLKERRGRPMTRSEALEQLIHDHFARSCTKSDTGAKPSPKRKPYLPRLEEPDLFL